MRSERGASLILALMILSFLAILGGALLTSSTIDVWVGDNFKTSFQLVYIAEAGLERAREEIRASLSSPTQLLMVASGTDGALLDSNDLDILLASDDQPLYPAGADAIVRADGEPLNDASGREIGRYWVWLRNDIADGAMAAADANQVLSLISFAHIGTSRKTIEMGIRKGKFPKMPAALTLGGDVALFDGAGGGFFRIDGNDFGGRSENAIGVIDTGSFDAVTSAIPENRRGNYAGSGGGQPDIENVEAEMEPSLKTPLGLESIVSSITASATDVYSPAFGSAQSIGDFGSPANYKVAIVNGDCNLGPGAGYGMLVVRGNLTVSGSFNWSGLILIVGQGGFNWTAVNGEVQGGVFIAKTRGARSLTDPLGPVLPSMGGVAANFNGALGPGIQYDTAQIAAANRRFPYIPISIREY